MYIHFFCCENSVFQVQWYVSKCEGGTRTQNVQIKKRSEDRTTCKRYALSKICVKNCQNFEDLLAKRVFGLDKTLFFSRSIFVTLPLPWLFIIVRVRVELLLSLIFDIINYPIMLNVRNRLSEK